MRVTDVLPSRRTTSAFVALGAIVLGAFWAASAWGESGRVAPPPAPEGFSLAADLSAEAEAASKTFGAEFPAGVELPSIAESARGIERQSPPGPVHFADGFAESMLITSWRCAWERAYLDAHRAEDGEGKAKAAGELMGYYDIEAVKKYVVDPDHLWHERVVLPAIDGDVTNLLDDMKHNCDPIFSE